MEGEKNEEKEGREERERGEGEGRPRDKRIISEKRDATVGGVFLPKNRCDSEPGGGTAKKVTRQDATRTTTELILMDLDGYHKHNAEDMDDAEGMGQRSGRGQCSGRG